MSEAAQILSAARAVIEERGQVYGDAARAFERVARRWSVTLGVEITPQQAVLCMIDLKLARLGANPAHKDSMVDVAGYAALLAEVGASN